MREPLFDDDSNKIILNFMKEWGHLPNPYANISKLIPQYNAKQIRQHWTNNLDPRLYHDPFKEEEKIFIVKQIEAKLTQNGKVSWKDLTHEFEHGFGKFCSGNKFKNFWYSRKKRLDGNQSASSSIHPPTVFEPKPDPPQFNVPYEMNPVF